MYKLLKLTTARFGRRRCSVSKGNTLADVAIARTDTFNGKWLFLNKKVLLDAIKNADDDLQKEILEVLVTSVPATIEIIGEESKLEDLSIEELFAYAKKLEIPTRKDNKKETLIDKINEKLGE